MEFRTGLPEATPLWLICKWPIWKKMLTIVKAGWQKPYSSSICRSWDTNWGSLHDTIQKISLSTLKYCIAHKTSSVYENFPLFLSFSSANCFYSTDNCFHTLWENLPDSWKFYLHSTWFVIWTVFISEKNWGYTNFFMKNLPAAAMKVGILWPSKRCIFPSEQTLTQYEEVGKDILETKEMDDKIP